MLVLEMGPSASGSGSVSVSIKQRVFDPDTDPEDPIASSLAASRGHADQGPANGIGTFSVPDCTPIALDCMCIRPGEIEIAIGIAIGIGVEFPSCPSIPIPISIWIPKSTKLMRIAGCQSRTSVSPRGQGSAYFSVPACTLTPPNTIGTLKFIV
jgi:hypothetical protein